MEKSNSLEHIYSRPRIDLSKLFKIQPRNGRNKNNKRGKKKIVFIIVIILVEILVAKRIIDSINPIIDSQCTSQARNIAIAITNRQSAIVMENYKYEDLVTIVKDSSGKIQLIKLNIVPVNEITSDVTLRIQDDINNTDYAHISVRLGALSGVKLLSGIGPKMKVKISCDGNVETAIKSTLKTAGINQTLHQVFIEIACEVNILTPYNNVSETIYNQILIAESIIMGEIPNSFYKTNGSESLYQMENEN